MAKMINIRKAKQGLFFCVWAIILLAIAQSSFAANKATGAASLNRIVAIVNDEAITENQLSQKVALATQQLKAADQSIPPKDILEKQVLQQMIDAVLQLQIAKTTGIRISQAETNQAIENIAKQNGQSVDALYQAVQQQGWTINGFREEIADQATIQKLEEREVASRISISQQDVDNFIRNNITPSGATLEYHLSVIFINLPEIPSSDDVASAKAQADSIVKQLNNGANFTELAARYSSGKSALHGGDLGWQKLAEMPREFTTVVPNMKAGEISDPIRVSNGFDIVRLLAKRRAAVSDQSQRKQVEEMLFERQFNEDLQTFLSRLRGEAYVKILL